MVNKLSSELMPGKHPTAGTYAEGGFHASGAVLRPWSTTQLADQPSRCCRPRNARSKQVWVRPHLRDHGPDQLNHDLAMGPRRGRTLPTSTATAYQTIATSASSP